MNGAPGAPSDRPDAAPRPPPADQGSSWSSERLEARLGAFGAHLAWRTPPLAPEIGLWLISEVVDLEAGCQALADGEAPPYWAFCWASGQALARHLLDHPELVRGRRVVDLGTGSGIAAIAAALAGAGEVVAIDVDPTARGAARLNAERNGVSIRTDARPPASFDLLLAADVVYETGLRDWILGEGRRRAACLLADPRRAGTPPIDFPVVATYAARTLPDVDPPCRSVYLHALPALEDAFVR
ncbi:MAG: 50S ribosomal protein L11 methyltransferase [Myxococcota bacterium]